MQQKRKSMRRVVYLAVTLGLILLVIGGSYLVYAAMTATDQKENDFQIGQVETKLEEVFDDSIEKIPKNQSIEKKVTIKNTGTINQFIRVMVMPEVRAEVAGETTNTQVLPLVIGSDLVLETIKPDEWKDGGDGYFYYIKEAVEPNKSTTSLFDSIRLANDLGSQYHNADFSLSLKVETINCNESAYQQAWWQGEVPTQQPLRDINDILKTMTDN